MLINTFVFLTSMDALDGTDSCEHSVLSGSPYHPPTNTYCYYYKVTAAHEQGDTALKLKCKLTKPKP